jgi:hypothetical protein
MCTSWVLGGRTIRRSRDAVCDPHCTHRGDEKHEFPSLTSKPMATACQWFDLKTTMIVSWFGPQNQCQLFGDLGLKITVTVSWFGPQNQVGGCLLVCALKSMSG